MDKEQILEFQKWLASNDASTYVDITEKVNDIAQTALDALQRVEELEKEIKKLERQSNQAIKDEGDSAYEAGMHRQQELSGGYERGEM